MKRIVLSLFGAMLLAVGGLVAPASAGTIYDPAFSATFPVGDKMIGNDIIGSEYIVGHKFGSHHGFTDTISFGVQSATNVALQILTFGAIDYSFTLTDGTTTAHLDSQSFSSSAKLGGYAGTMVTDLLSLNATGTWLLTITGTACSCAGYVVSLAGAAVTPLPPALLMFLTALGGMVLLAWRRGAIASFGSLV
jgi:hypothetical protein